MDGTSISQPSDQQNELIGLVHIWRCKDSLSLAESAVEK